MARNENEYAVVAFDPGGCIGWVHIRLDYRAFTRPENKVLANVIDWECGEFSGTEHQQCQEASKLIWRAKFGDMPFNSHTDVVSGGLSRADILSEDFELTQLIGGNNLLSPVRINAILGYECARLGLKLNLQKRSLRTRVTPVRLTYMGFNSPFRRTGSWSTQGRGKDAFAAMQHAIVWLRRIKKKSLRRPWKLGKGGVENREWDCACSRGRRCDLVHPR